MEYLFTPSDEPARLADHLPESTRCSGHFLTKSCRMIQYVMSFHHHYEQCGNWRRLTAWYQCAVWTPQKNKLSMNILRREGMAGGLSSADLASAEIIRTDTIFSCWTEEPNRQRKCLYSRVTWNDRTKRILNTMHGFLYMFLYLICWRMLCMSESRENKPRNHIKRKNFWIVVCYEEAVFRK